MSDTSPEDFDVDDRDEVEPEDGFAGIADLAKAIGDYDDSDEFDHTIKEWKNLRVKIRTGSLESRNKALTFARGGGDGKIDISKFYAGILAYSLRNPNTGRPIFSDEKIAHRALKGKRPGTIEDLVKLASKGQLPQEDAGKDSSSTDNSASSLLSQLV